MIDDQAQPVAAQEPAPAPEQPQQAQQQEPEVPQMMPGQVVPLGAIPNVFRVIKVPGALAVNQKTGERVQIYVVQVHTPMGVMTFFMAEDAIRDLGRQCSDVAGPGISIAPANALDALTRRNRG